MMSRLGEKYNIEIETTSKPKDKYITDEYFELDTCQWNPRLWLVKRSWLRGAMSQKEEKLEASFVKPLACRRSHNKKAPLAGS